MITSKLAYEVQADDGTIFPAGTTINIDCEDLLDAMSAAMADAGIECELPNGEWRFLEMDTAGLC